MSKKVLLNRINKTIAIKKQSDHDLYQKLKEAEEQIKNGEVVDADIVFAEMRKKYGY